MKVYCVQGRQCQSEVQQKSFERDVFWLMCSVKCLTGQWMIMGAWFENYCQWTAGQKVVRMAEKLRDLLLHVAFLACV